MKEINHNNCDGCAVYLSPTDPHDVGCEYPQQNDKGECSCTVCVIKMMCEEPCEDYTEFRKIAIFRERGK